MRRKHLIYVTLVAGLLLLNAIRIAFLSDQDAALSDVDGQGLLVDTAAFELGSLGEDDGDAEIIVRDLFAPLRPEVAVFDEPSKPVVPAPVQPQGPSKEALARQLAQEDLDKFALAGVLVKDSKITAMLTREDNHFVARAGEWVGKDVLIQEISFDDVVLVNQQWGLERILSVEKAEHSDKD